MPRARKFYPITDKEELRALCGGRWSRNPKARCNQCKTILLKGRTDRGAAAGKGRVEVIGLWCPKCRHFFKKRLVKVTVATYLDGVGD